MRKERNAMKHWKKLTALGLALALTLSLAACGGKKGTEQTEPAQQPYTVRAAAMTGPTGMGLAKLLEQFGVAETVQEEPLVQETSANGGSYNFLLAGTADEISPRLIKGELDVACVPANLAAVLYQKTGGDIVTLGINTLGVLYVVDKGESVQTLADLKGKTLVSAGKGSVPEYGLRHLLAKNGIDPDRDLTIEWKSEQSECVAALAAGTADIAVMPQPYVTVAQGKIDRLRIAVDLAEEWEKLNDGSAMVTGVVVARRAFVQEHPEAVETFLQDYADSVDWVNSDPAAAAQTIGSYGIVAAAVAEKAIPYCSITCITGTEMEEMLSGYLAALYAQEPAAVGGALPEKDFYWGAE